MPRHYGDFTLLPALLLLLLILRGINSAWKKAVMAEKQRYVGLDGSSSKGF